MSHLVVSALVLALSTVLFSAPAVAQTSNTLTDAQVACDRAQLGALVARTSVLGLDGGLSPVVQSLLFGYSNRFGFYEGLVVGMSRFRPTAEPPVIGFGPGPEHQLAFHLNPSVRQLLLNPERPTLAQVSMTREVSASSLVDPGSEAEAPFAVRVRLRPTLGPGTGPDAGDLVIDNLASPPVAGDGFRPADTKPGRGLVAAGLTEPCHTRRTDLDRRVSAILQRTLRVELWDSDRGLRYDTRVALFRNREPGVFGADVYAVDPETGDLLEGFLDLLLEAHADGSGRLRDGRLVVGSFDLPGNPRVEGTVSIVRPLFGGVDTAYQPVVSAPVNSPLSAVWDLPFDWADVLEGTAWNLGGGVAPCGHGTASEIAATPRADRSTELLALSMGQGLTADQGTYDRLVRDLAAIRAQEPAVDGISMFATTDAKSLRVTPADAATFEAIARGEYHEWDCLNDWYELEGVGVPEIGTVPDPPLPVEVQLEGLYALEPVAEDYAALPGIASASPLIFPLPGAPAGTFPSLCAREADGGVFRYFFDVPIGGPPLTYFFRTTADGAVELVGVYNPASLGPAPPPAWLPLVDECYAHLRYGIRW